MKRLFIYLGFFLGTVFILLGTATLVGLLIPRDSLKQFQELKWILGIVLLLYGVYRIIFSYFNLKKFNKDNQLEKESLE